MLLPTSCRLSHCSSCVGAVRPHSPLPAMRRASKACYGLGKSPLPKILASMKGTVFTGVWNYVCSVLLTTFVLHQVRPFLTRGNIHPLARLLVIVSETRPIS